MTLVFIIIIVCLLVGYVPLVLVIAHRDMTRTLRKRPVNEVLAEAFAQGEITRERYETLMDEVHQAMPTLDAPYPLVREITLR